MQLNSAVALSLIISSMFLSSCSTKTVTEQSKTITSLETQNSSLKKELKNIQEVKKGKSVNLSGIIRIGKDLSPGFYNIKLLSDKEETFRFYPNKRAFDEHKAENELLSPNLPESGSESDIRRNYKLEKGNILEIDNKLEFTRTG